MRSFFVLLVVLIAGMGSSSRALAGFPYPPVFEGTPYIIEVDLTPPGLESFIFTGYVSDMNSEDTVTPYMSSHPAIFSFDSTPGNPATFTFSGWGLSYHHAGTYNLGFSAIDDSIEGLGTVVPVVVRIVPEPSIVSALIVFSVCALHRQINP